MSPAEELTAAAKAMRERAEAATAGPWAAWVMGSEGYLVLREHGSIRDRSRSRVARVGMKDWDADKADAEYVASMHPGVALAVADWLARFADPVYCYGPAEYDAALNIARAYLGSGEAGR